MTQTHRKKLLAMKKTLYNTRRAKKEIHLPQEEQE